ncbi:MAG: RNA-directed DNA polymerase [Planctomycetes bacterium]|nr:RNA-directed DNA polymerase [Planctomycetota bacterium]
MGLMDFIRRRFGGGSGRSSLPAPDVGMDEKHLAGRLGVLPGKLELLNPTYKVFEIPKRGGGRRKIEAPAPMLKEMQNLILRKLLRRLKAHPCAYGFERGRSIAGNAAVHAGKAVVVRLDLKDFFPSISADRVRRYFRRIGWNGPAAELLVKVCTHEGRLPQGAPTSPRLSNLVNYSLDAGLLSAAKKYRADYTRYADDITFSFAIDDPGRIRSLIGSAKAVLSGEGYRINLHKKLRVARSHQRQKVTGLVVNSGVKLPRATRRRLRAIRHRLAAGKQATLTAAQLAGWTAFEAMIAAHDDPAAAGGQAS